MVSEALDGLTDEQLAELELQESGLVSGQSEGAIAFTPFAQRTNPQAAQAPTQEPAALSDYELNKLEEENYRRADYVMTPQEFDQYWDRREKEDQEVGRFIEGLGQGAAGLVGMIPEAGRELRDAAVGMVTDPVNQVQRNIQTGAETIRKAGVNLVQLYDWVSNKVDDLATSSKRAEAINAGIMDRLIADGKMTGDRERDMQIYQAALAEARESGAYKPTAEQVREDRNTAYERYVREKALERDFANVSQFKTGESQMSSPTTAETYQITDEQPMQAVSQLGSMVIDPVNLIPMGAGALSKARVLRRMAVLSEKPLAVTERAAAGLADVAERIETGLSTRIQDITGMTQKQQAAIGAGIAGTAVYVDSATDSQGGLTKAVMMVGGVLPALHYGGGLLRKVGSAAGGAATVVREAGVGGLGVARAEAAAGLAGNAAIPERYRRFFTGYVEGTDSTLKRVAQDAGNPETLRRVARFADRMGATQVARAADDAVSGAVRAGIVGTPFAALQPDAERAGEVMGGILTLGAAGGLVGGLARRRSPEVVDADIARMFADIQAIGGDVDGFARLPHATLDKISSMQGVLAGKVDFIPLKADEYRQNVDKSGKNGESTAGLFMDKDGTGRARLYINMGASRDPAVIAPHEIGHAILTSNVLDGQPRADLRNLVNQQYGPDGVASRGREYIGRMVDAELRQGVTGEMPTVLTEAEMAMFDSGRTMEDIVAERAKDPAERDRLINERMEEFNQRSIDKGEDPLDWARDEIIAETFASEAPAIDFRAIRRDAMFPRFAESMLSAGGRVLEMFGANLSTTGRLLDNPSTLFRDNPLFQDRIMQKRVREYVRSYDQFLSGLEEAGSAAPKGVELARSNRPQDLANSTHVKLRDEGRGVLENDFLFQKPDGTYSFKPQPLINKTEASRAAQIKTLYDARKFVPVNSTEFGKRKVNGRETIGGPVLPPQFDLFTHFPQHVREFARAMEQSRAEGGSWDIDYNAIGTGSSGRYRITNMGAVRAIQRETVPLGWQITKQNHLLAVAIDLNAFRAATMKAINRGELGIFNNDMKQVEADLKIRLANHREGRPGEAIIGQAKRDILNGLIGTGTAVQRAANPLYAELNPKGSLRTWRVDRLNDAKPTGRTGYFFDYDKENNNRMPQALPREAMGMPDVPANLSTDQILRELEENQGYLGLSTLGMREGRPVRGGAQRTRELLRRNEELNAELRRRGGAQEESDVERVLRQRGQAMPDAQVTDDGLVRVPENAPTFTLPRRAMAQFMPDTGVDLADYADRTILALPADRMGIGSMMVGPKGKEREVSVKGQGGAGFMEIYNGGGWAFSDEATGNRFMKRLREAAEPGEASVLVGITAMSEFNHLKNQTGQLAYVEALEAAIAGKSISRKQADAHIKAISQSIVQSTAKSVTDSTRRKFAAIKNFNDFAKAVRNKSLNFADAAPYSVQIARRALPIPYKEAKDIGIAFDDIGKQTADPRYADVPFGTVVALLEVTLDQAPVRSDFHYSYPFKVTGRRIGFLKKYYDVGQLTSDPRIRNSAGAVQAQPLQTVLPKLDRARNVTRGQAMPDVVESQIVTIPDAKFPNKVAPREYHIIGSTNDADGNLIRDFATLTARMKERSSESKDRVYGKKFMLIIDGAQHEFQTAQAATKWLQDAGIQSGATARLFRNGNNQIAVSFDESLDAATERAVRASVANNQVRELSQSELPPNTALLNLVNNNGRVTGVVGLPYDGTPEGLIAAHAKLERQVAKNYKWREQYTRSMSQRGGTDAEGRPAFVVSANLKNVAAVGTPQARYILGDLDADPGPAPAPQERAALPAPKGPKQDPATMTAAAINRELDDLMMQEGKLKPSQKARERELKKEVKMRAGDAGRIPPLPYPEYQPRKRLES